MTFKIRIATRRSKLALRQVEIVKSFLGQEVQTDIVEVIIREPTVKRITAQIYQPDIFSIGLPKNSEMPDFRQINNHLIAAEFF